MKHRVRILFLETLFKPLFDLRQMIRTFRPDIHQRFRSAQLAGMRQDELLDSGHCRTLGRQIGDFAHQRVGTPVVVLGRNPAVPVDAHQHVVLGQRRQLLFIDLGIDEPQCRENGDKRDPYESLVSEKPLQYPLVPASEIHDSQFFQVTVRRAERAFAIKKIIIDRNDEHRNHQRRKQSDRNGHSLVVE